MKKDKTSRSWVVNVTSGAVAGMTSAVLFHPLTVIMTRFQVTPKSGHTTVGYQYQSFRHAVSSIYRQEGVAAFYQGLTPSLVGYTVLTNLEKMDGYRYNEARKSVARGKAQEGDSRDEQTIIRSLSPLVNLSCGMVAGISSSFFTVPISTVKTRMAIQVYNQPGNYTDMNHAFRTIWREEGVSGLYRGLTPSLLSVSNGAIHFAVYEELSKLVRKKEHISDLHFYQSFGCGALSKMMASMVTYPCSVVKSRLRVRPLPGQDYEYKGVWQTFQKIWRYEGIAGFYRGCTINLIKVTPGSAVSLAVYETVAQYLSQPNK